MSGNKDNLFRLIDKTNLDRQKSQERRAEAARTSGIFEAGQIISEVINHPEPDQSDYSDWLIKALRKKVTDKQSAQTPWLNYAPSDGITIDTLEYGLQFSSQHQGEISLSTLYFGINDIKSDGSLEIIITDMRDRDVGIWRKSVYRHQTPASMLKVLIDFLSAPTDNGFDKFA